MAAVVPVVWAASPATAPPTPSAARSPLVNPSTEGGAVLNWRGLLAGLSAGPPGTAAPGPLHSGNLLAGVASHFNGTTGGWVGENARLSWVATAGAGAAGALSLLPTTAQPEPVTASSPAPGQPGAVAGLAGLLYTGTAAVSTSGPPEYVQGIVAFYDASGKLLTSAAGQSTEVSTSWTTLIPVVAMAPPTTATVAMGIVAWSRALLGQRTLMKSPSLVATVDRGSPPVVGPLHVTGDTIVQGNGTPVTLRGVELYGLQSSPTLSPSDAAAVDEAKAWGANMVRVALGEQFWLGTSCTYSPAYAGAVDAVVHEITSLGMVALLDLHFNSLVPCTPGGPQMMADDPGSVDFWRSVAARYAGNPLVAFDLYNEPHGISDAVWLAGGTVVSGVLPFHAAGMQQLYDAVRGAGAQNLVVVSGNDWGNTLPPARVSGSNIAYGAHDYSCPNAPPPSCDTPDPSDASTLLDSWVQPAASVPVVVSEFGWPSQDSGTFIGNVIAFAATHGWSWNAFAFDGTAPFGLLAAGPGPGGGGAAGSFLEPSASGMPVLAALADSG